MYNVKSIMELHIGKSAATLNGQAALFLFYLYL